MDIRVVEAWQRKISRRSSTVKLSQYDWSCQTLHEPVRCAPSRFHIEQLMKEETCDCGQVFTNTPEHLGVRLFLCPGRWLQLALRARAVLFARAPPMRTCRRPTLEVPLLFCRPVSSPSVSLRVASR